MHSFNWLITQVDQAGLQVIEISLPMPWVLGLKACATVPSIPLFPRLTLNSQTLLASRGLNLQVSPYLLLENRVIGAPNAPRQEFLMENGLAFQQFLTLLASLIMALLPTDFFLLGFVWLRVLSSIASMLPSVLEFTVSSQAHNKVASSSHLCPSFLTVKSGIPQAT